MTAPLSSPTSPDPAAAPFPWKWLPLSLLSGVLSFVAFAGIDIWPLAFVAAVPHFVAVARGAKTTKHVLALGFAYGFTTNAGGYYWIVEMLTIFSGFHVALCVLGGVLVWSYQAGQLTIATWAWNRLRMAGVPAAFAFALIHPAVEWAYPFLFHHYFGNSFHTVPALIQIADLGGALVVTALTAVVNGAIFDVLEARRAGHAFPRAPVAVAAASLVFTLGYGAYRIAEVDRRVAASPELKVALVQANMGLREKHENPYEGVERHIAQSQLAESQHQPDLIFWPESAYTFLISEDVKNMRRYFTGELHTPVLFGGLMSRLGPDRRRSYNTAFLIDGDGDILGSYDKVFLLPFGEYLPFGERFPKLYEISKHSGRFTPGDEQKSLEFEGHRIAPLICYEDIVPDFVRAVVNKTQPELLVNLTNDAWFGDTTEPWEHLALAKFRAVEHHLYLVRATNSGVSAIVDPVGRVLTHGPVFERATLSGTVRWMKGRTLYQTVGDVAGWGSATVVVVLLWRSRRKRPVAAGS
jgi:apolipoprotein N-acyltransferase